jgi:hypothetical protein
VLQEQSGRGVDEQHSLLLNMRVAMLLKPRKPAVKKTGSQFHMTDKRPQRHDDRLPLSKLNIVAWKNPAKVVS